MTESNINTHLTLLESLNRESCDVFNREERITAHRIWMEKPFASHYVLGRKDCHDLYIIELAGLSTILC